MHKANSKFEYLTLGVWEIREVLDRFYLFLTLLLVISSKSCSLNLITVHHILSPV